MTPSRDGQGVAGVKSDLRDAAADFQRAATRLAAALDGPAANGPDLTATIAHLDSARDLASRTEEALLPKLLPYNTTVVQRWIAALSDPDYPAIGQELLDKMAGGGVKTILDATLDCLASYVSFSLKPEDPSLINAIKYGVLAARNQEALFVATVHESTHALQMLCTPALHASPFHARAFPQIVVCPRDWVLLAERCEQDAFAKQAWLNTLAAQQNQALWDVSAKSALSAHDFAAVRAQSSDMRMALRMAAAGALTKSYWSNNPASSHRFANYYHDIVLKQYSDAMDQRESAPQYGGFVFVRLEAEDIYAAGNSFGPNPFGGNPQDPSLLLGTPLNCGTPSYPEAADRLRHLNQRLGIVDESTLPTFREVLARYGLTPQGFLESTFRSPAAAPAPSPAP